MRSLLSIVLLTPALVLAQPHRPRQQGPAADSVALRFAREFYAWYVPAQARGTDRGVEIVLKGRPEVLGQELRRALEQDSLAQSRAQGEIDGLDFDPFLNSQDPCERYQVRRVLRSGSVVKAEVYGTCRAGRGARPDAVLELVPKGGSWIIQNVRYSARSDLLGQLRLLHSVPKSASPSAI